MYYGAATRSISNNYLAETRMSVLWREILETSSLATCMQDIYEAVSQNKIAALQLETPEGTIAHSVQIPIPFYLTDLPPEEEADSTRGLWITTANYFVEEDSMHDPAFFDKHFGLLLMSDEKKIIAELQADADEATAAMVEFVRLSKPTMSCVITLFLPFSEPSWLSKPLLCFSIHSIFTTALCYHRHPPLSANA